MNYKKIYDSLIQKAVDRNWSKSTATCYTETHHIIPKCVGGTNHIENLIELTASEHYLAHQLLVKIYKNNSKLIYALHCMSIQSGKHIRNNKEFSWIKEKFISEIKTLHRGKSPSAESRKKMSDAKKISQIGSGNSFYGKTHTLETRKKISDAQKKRVHETGMTRSDETKQKISDAKIKTIWKIQYPDGSINIVRGLRKFCKELGLSEYSLKQNKLDYKVIEQIGIK